jgi:hypothetical protein
LQARLLLLALLVVALLVGATSLAAASSAPKWKVGDRVEGYDTYTSTWEKGTIFLVEDYRSTGSSLYYKERLDRTPPGSTQNELLLRENQIRALGAGAKGKTFKVGSTVDVYYESNRQGKNRGKIIAAAGGRYKIHYLGCTKTWDEWVDRLAVKSPAQISVHSAKIKFLAGKWIMFTPSYPNTVVHDGKIYREYGTGARTPPLTIKANGTFVWYFDFGKKPVRGHWKTDAKVPGADTGTQSVDGVLIKDPDGNPWKAFRWTPKGDHKDRIEAQRMCSGEADIGTRA